VASKNSEYSFSVSQQLVKLSADGMSDTVDMANLVSGKPFLRGFVVKASGKELHVSSETDPSSTSPYRYTLLNAQDQQSRCGRGPARGFADDSRKAKMGTHCPKRRPIHYRR